MVSKKWALTALIYMGYKDPHESQFAWRHSIRAGNYRESGSVQPDYPLSRL